MQQRQELEGDTCPPALLQGKSVPGSDVGLAAVIAPVQRCLGLAECKFMRVDVYFRVLVCAYLYNHRRLQKLANWNQNGPRALQPSEAIVAARGAARRHCCLISGAILDSCQNVCTREWCNAAM